MNLLRFLDRLRVLGHELRLIWTLEGEELERHAKNDAEFDAYMRDLESRLRDRRSPH